MEEEDGCVQRIHRVPREDCGQVWRSVIWFRRDSGQSLTLSVHLAIIYHLRGAACN